MTYNVQTKQFNCTDFALSLAGGPGMNTFHVQTPNERDNDEAMTDA